MTDTIVGAATHTPKFITAYLASRESANVIHESPAGGAPLAVVLRAAHLRRGTLEALFLTEAAAKACADDVAGARTFTVNSTTRTTINATCVASGAIVVELDNDSRDLWLVRVDYQEIAP